VALALIKKVRWEKKVRLRWGLKGELTTWNLKKDSERSWRSNKQEVQKWQTYLYWGFEIHSSCYLQVVGEYANALGIGKECKSTLPYNWCYYVCQWNPKSNWASLHCIMGVNVDYDEKREER
jgi:hypothetical protein